MNERGDTRVVALMKLNANMNERVKVSIAREPGRTHSYVSPFGWKDREIYPCLLKGVGT